jgi:hypothetical protein
MERTTLHVMPILSRRTRVGHLALPELALFVPPAPATARPSRGTLALFCTIAFHDPRPTWQGCELASFGTIRNPQSETRNREIGSVSRSGASRRCRTVALHGPCPPSLLPARIGFVWRDPPRPGAPILLVHAHFRTPGTKLGLFDTFHSPARSPHILQSSQVWLCFA